VKFLRTNNKILIFLAACF